MSVSGATRPLPLATTNVFANLGFSVLWSVCSENKLTAIAVTLRACESFVAWPSRLWFCV